jgi:hypothetical protein
VAIGPTDLVIHDEVLVETDLDGSPVSLPSFVTNVLDGELWLALRQPDPRLKRIDPGTRIHLTFDRGGAFVVESEFLRRLGGSSDSGARKSLVFAVRRPQDFERAERRAQIRMVLERDVRIKSSGTLAGDAVGAGRTVNVGPGGVQLVTKMPLMFGDRLRLALALTARDIVVAAGQVTRIEEVPAPALPGSVGAPRKRKAITRVAVRFDRISEQDGELITRHILAALRDGTAFELDRAPEAAPDASAGLRVHPTAEPRA